ncbi:MAG: hypothetical protein K8J31_02715 [Anaerolineae bacterium]|jgi:hypothetical protein|nr:hypothetical protein [Anaerolineae bacterium]
MAFLTPDFFNLLVIVVIILGLALAAVRLYDDFTRPLLPDEPPVNPDEDTQPHHFAVPEHHNTSGE